MPPSWSLLTVLALIAVSDAYDPTLAHGGVLRPLNLDAQEIDYTSTLHATANYHKLMQFVRAKLQEAENLTYEEYEAIERFLHRMKPPTALKHMLTNAERAKIADLHSQKDIDRSLKMIEQAIFRLSIPDRRHVVEYIFRQPEPFMLEHFHIA